MFARAGVWLTSLCLSVSLPACADQPASQTQAQTQAQAKATAKAQAQAKTQAQAKAQAQAQAKTQAQADRAAPSCEEVIAHTHMLNARRIQERIAKAPAANREKIRREMDDDTEAARKWQIRTCEADSTPAFRRCVLETQVQDQLKQCVKHIEVREGHRPGPPLWRSAEAPSCERMLERVRWVLARTMEEVLRSVPEDERQDERTRMEERKSDTVAAVLSACTAGFSPAMRRCMVDVVDLGDMFDCEKAHGDGRWGWPPSYLR